MQRLINTVRRKILMGENLMNLVNCQLFAKFSSPIFTDTLKMYLTYALTVAYWPDFSLPIAFTCMVRQNFLPPNISRVQ